MAPGPFPLIVGPFPLTFILLQYWAPGPFPLYFTTIRGNGPGAVPLGPFPMDKLDGPSGMYYIIVAIRH